MLIGQKKEGKYAQSPLIGKQEAKVEFPTYASLSLESSHLLHDGEESPFSSAFVCKSSLTLPFSSLLMIPFPSD